MAAASELLLRPLLTQLARVLEQTISTKLSDKLAAAATATAATAAAAAADAGVGAQYAGVANVADRAGLLTHSAAVAARQAALQRALNALHQCAHNTPKLWAQVTLPLPLTLPLTPTPTPTPNPNPYPNPYPYHYPYP